MAGLPDRLIAQVAFKGGGDVLHEILGKKPQHLTKVIPNKVQFCELQQGQFGTAGSVIYWKYIIGWKEQTSKVLLQDVDEENKQIGFKMVEGDLADFYKNMVVTFHVETKGGIDYITWTIEYELKNADDPHPVSLLNYCIEFVKEAEAHIFG